MVAIFVEAIESSPVDFGIPLHGGKRTDSEQYSLYCIGRYGDGRKVITYKDGYKRRSKHQRGMAIDFYAFVDGKPNWEAKNFKLIARHIQKVAKERYHVNLKWGGDWKIKDLPHMQLPKRYD